MPDNSTEPTTAGVADDREFLEQAQPGRSRRSLLPGLTRSQAGVLGVYESADDEGYVRVRLDSTDEVVRARLNGFPDDFQLEPGDELGVVADGDELATVAHVHRAVERGTRTEFWTINRHSGDLRLLSRRPTGDTGHENPTGTG